MKKSLKGYFITGLLVVVPLYISVYVLSLIVGALDRIFLILPESLRPEAYLHVRIPGLGIVFTVILVFLAGVLTTNFLGRPLWGVVERLLLKVPVLRLVYNSSKQFLETFFMQDGEGFRKVVLVEFPRKGAWSMGFLTGKTRGEMKRRLEGACVNVFIPTTPNPTSGFYVVVKESEVVPLDMSVEDAFKVLMTGGMVVPREDELKASLAKDRERGAP